MQSVHRRRCTATRAAGPCRAVGRAAEVAAVDRDARRGRVDRLEPVVAQRSAVELDLPGVTAVGVETNVSPVTRRTSQPPAPPSTLSIDAPRWTTKVSLFPPRRRATRRRRRRARPQCRSRRSKPSTSRSVVRAAQGVDRRRRRRRKPGSPRSRTRREGSVSAPSAPVILTPLTDAGSAALGRAVDRQGDVPVRRRERNVWSAPAASEIAQSAGISDRCSAGAAPERPARLGRRLSGAAAGAAPGAGALRQRALLRRGRRFRSRRRFRRGPLPARVQRLGAGAASAAGSSAGASDGGRGSD